jgi:hypothetical protein
MRLAGFEPMIQVFKRAKTFHALDRAATVTGPSPELLGGFILNVAYDVYTKRTGVG